MSIEDLIAEEDIVVTITRGGYVKRTKTDDYRSQKRGGKGVRGREAASRTTSSTTSSSRPPTTGCCSSPTRAGSTGPRRYELPDAGRDARGQHVANLLAFQPDEQIAQILDIRDYEVAPYLVLATQGGLVKKTRSRSTTPPRPAASSRSTCARSDES